VPRDALGQRPLERFAVRPREHQHFAGGRVLCDDGYEAIAFREVDSIQLRGPFDDHAPPRRISRTERASAAFVATPLFTRCPCAPLQSVNTPPASSMMGTSAAVSQSASTGSPLTSARPVATSA